MLDIRQLRAVDAVAHHGSMAAAARVLGWSQPTLAHHIDTLESYLRAPVVHRHARGSELTPAGHALQSYAGRILELTVLAEQAARSAEPVLSRVTVGVFSTAGAFVLPPAIPPLHEQGISVEIVQEDDAAALRHTLDQGVTDAAILFSLPDEEPPRAGLELFREPLYVLLPDGHRLAHKTRLSLAELTGEAWVMAKSAGDPCDEMLLRSGQQAGFHPRCVLRTDDYTVTQGYVAVGLGIALVPAMALLFAGPVVVAVPVADPGMERVIRLELAPHATPSPSAAALTAALRASAKRLSRQLATVHAPRTTAADASATL